MTTLYIHDVERLEPSRVDKLSGFRTPDLANALGDEAELCGADIRPVWSSPPVIGNALTVQLSASDNLGAIAASLLAHSGDILVISSGGAPSNALVGGRLARVAMSRGVRACVVDGGVRDLDDLERLGFPVFARAIVARRATKHGPATLGCTVRCGEATVRSGDAVVADRDGVAIIPAHLLDSAIAKIAAGATSERDEENDFALLERRFAAATASVPHERLPIDRTR